MLTFQQCLLFLIFVVSNCYSTRQSKIDQEAFPADASRQKKVFSLFSIVTFQNNGCVTQQGTTNLGRPRNGTCYTQSECLAKGGSGSGNCASGFGVCCFFHVMITGNFNQNNTYIRNPGFPGTTPDAATITYTINKAATDVCDLRLDFETFVLLGPTTTSDAADTTDNCPDKMSVSSSSSFLIPEICGLNSGQHIYIDMGNGPTDTATLTFTFSAIANAKRSWEIQATQLQCWSPSRPPSGCLQYFTTWAGRITSFNFFGPSPTMHLINQKYDVCIRQSEGACCIQYQVCPGQADSFTLDHSSSKADASDVGTECTTDYIEVPGSSSTCLQMSGQSNINSRYCGRFLANVVGVTKGNFAICDCTAPFTVRIATDDGADTGIAATTPTSKGLCLDYTQVQCI